MTTKEEKATLVVDELSPADKAHIARDAREARIRQLLRDDDELLGKAYDSRLVKRLFTYIAPYKNSLIVAVILMTISSLAGTAGPAIIGFAIDKGIRANSFDVLRFWTLVFLFTTITEWLTNRARVRIMAFVGTKIVADVRSELFRHLHRLTLNFYSNYSVGRLMSRLIGDVGVLLDFVTWSITGLFRSVFNLVGIIIAMLLLNWQLALVAFAVMPLMIILTSYWRDRVRQAYRATRQRLALINGYLNESISGIRVTKSFTREERNFQHFDDLNLSFFDANIQATRLSALFFPGVDFIGSLATALVVGVGGWLVLGDALTAGTLVAVVLYVERFFDPIRELAQRYNTFQATMAASERLFELLDLEPDLVDAPGAIPLPQIRGEVEFKDVSFAYREKGRPVLNNINLLAKPGERIALVGETGAGKSTIIRLLSRFYDVTDGSLTIDGHDVREVTSDSLRQQLGIVLQDTFLFTGTVADNIRYGRLNATDEEVLAASKAVGAHDFISRMPDGYDSEVGENGSNLSVGQRQLVSFARALLADPRILILDEATSSVDTATERIIQRALDTLMEGRTSFVIAHRLSTIINADQIIVLDHGRIIEQGTHQELLARRGRYFNLYTMQWAQQKNKHLFSVN
ncbi:MAG TPA: ABC transporter ATP-binding protein [Promineifilum sp.]|nr:ABC transporter ATP-binding protein [Promineifilum sp.]HRO88873.1 ABC transporter ATP-binding protein [Promineifilum sp.]HRQ11884.1 ABC transporter ATP-binding protein [Promineifilum sp.]